MIFGRLLSFLGMGYAKRPGSNKPIDIGIGGTLPWQLGSQAALCARNGCCRRWALGEAEIACGVDKIL